MCSRKIKKYLELSDSDKYGRFFWIQSPNDEITVRMPKSTERR